MIDKNEDLETILIYRADEPIEKAVILDILNNCEIPIIHTPELSMGLFGVVSENYVTIPKYCFDNAQKALEEEGFKVLEQRLNTGLNSPLNSPYMAILDIYRTSKKYVYFYILGNFYGLLISALFGSIFYFIDFILTFSQISR